MAETNTSRDVLLQAINELKEETKEIKKQLSGNQNRRKHFADIVQENKSIRRH